MRQRQERHDDYRNIGRVLRPHGVRGELRIEAFAEDTTLFERDSLLLGRRAERLTAYDVESLRIHQGKVLLKLVGVTGREEADAFRGLLVFMARDELPPLADGEFYLYELIGMAVVTEDNTAVGTVKDVLRTGANDVFVVQTADKELLLPDIEEVVLAVQRNEKQIVVRLIEGLA